MKFKNDKKLITLLLSNYLNSSFCNLELVNKHIDGMTLDSCITTEFKLSYMNLGSYIFYF